MTIHIERRLGQRFIRQILEIKRYDPALDRYELESVYESN